MVHHVVDFEYTGKTNCVIRLMEVHYKRPMQWNICLQHANELPLQHLFHHLDGKTTGPSTFLGPFGKMLNDCHKRQIVNFQQIATELPNLDGIELSNDQNYMYNIVQAVPIDREMFSAAIL